MTVKERVMRRIDTLDEVLELERQLEALRAAAGLPSDPKAYAFYPSLGRRSIPLPRSTEIFVTRVRRWRTPTFSSRVSPLPTTPCW
jgi:hypothetical protein